MMKSIRGLYRDQMDAQHNIIRSTGPTHFDFTDPDTNDVPTADVIMQALAFAKPFLEGKVMYYLMAVSPYWNDRVLGKVSIPEPFTWPALKDNMIRESSLTLSDKAALIARNGDKWTDIGDIRKDQKTYIPRKDYIPQVLNIIAIRDEVTEFVESQVASVGRNHESCFRRWHSA
eukprot:GHVU01171454.1.p1 GENE.GHVU01171454.1~~GHVU01171454.1.p1  ORF type:complete len:174 (-),score=13.01 GHVU01171454.1:77-598(-)